MYKFKIPQGNLYNEGAKYLANMSPEVEDGVNIILKIINKREFIISRCSS